MDTNNLINANHNVTYNDPNLHKKFNITDEKEKEELSDVIYKYDLISIFGLDDFLEEIIIEKINNLYNTQYSKIRIGKIWDIDITYCLDIYKNVAWYFAGTVFGGDKTHLVSFADKTKEKCIEIITTKNTLMWEVNIWYLVYLDNKKLFDAYFCDHNDSTIDNY